MFYNSYYRWLALFTLYRWSWHECLQARHGNIFSIRPIGENFLKFPKHKHPFHILKPSPWPICVALSLFVVVSGFIDFLTFEQEWFYSIMYGFSVLGISLWGWWRDVVMESLVEHTKRIKRGIAIGMVLFIISEVMFFFSFFWAFFHVSLSPSIELGCVWPPKGLEKLVISPFGAPLLNTVILLSSGVTITCAHHAFLLHCYKQKKLANFLSIMSSLMVLRGIRNFYRLSRIGGYAWWEFQSKHFKKLLNVFLKTHFDVIRRRLFYNVLTNSVRNRYFLYCFRYFVCTLFLAFFFTFSQIIEYLESAVSISDGVYGSTFFVMTGFHGFHVIVGTVFLFVCFVRILLFRYSYMHFVGLECAIWYWHFVDVVWLFLFIFVYYWGNAFIPILDLSMFESFTIVADFAKPFQFGFQDSASFLMESIVDLHNYIMFYLLLIFGIVAWMLFAFSFLNISSSLKKSYIRLIFFFFDLKTTALIARRGYYLFNAKKESLRWNSDLFLEDVQSYLSGKGKDEYEPYTSQKRKVKKNINKYKWFLFF